MARAELVTPDWELVIRDSEGEDIFLAGFFVEENGETDVALGIKDEATLHAVRALLDAATLAVSGSLAWFNADDIQLSNKGKEVLGDEFPF